MPNRPARMAESTADWLEQSTRVAPPTPRQSMHLAHAAARQAWASRTPSRRSRRSDCHTSVSRLIRLQLGAPAAPMSSSLGPRLASRRSSDWAPPETTPATPISIPLEEDNRHLSLGLTSSRQPRRSYKWGPSGTTPTTPDPASLEEDSSHSSPVPRPSRCSRRISDWAPHETTPPETTPKTLDPTLLEEGHHVPSGLTLRSRRYSYRALFDSMVTPSSPPTLATFVSETNESRMSRRSTGQGSSSVDEFETDTEPHGRECSTEKW